MPNVDALLHQGYLRVSDALIAYWNEWLAAHTRGKRIGINWQGNANHHADVYRTLALKQLRPPSEIEGAILSIFNSVLAKSNWQHVDLLSGSWRFPITWTPMVEPSRIQRRSCKTWLD